MMSDHRYEGLAKFGYKPDLTYKSLSILLSFFGYTTEIQKYRNMMNFFPHFMAIENFPNHFVLNF
jgi:hypothetical protein